jgi:hypothetical protein
MNTMPIGTQSRVLYLMKLQQGLLLSPNNINPQSPSSRVILPPRMVRHCGVMAVKHGTILNPHLH